MFSFAMFTARLAINFYEERGKNHFFEMKDN